MLTASLTRQSPFTAVSRPNTCTSISNDWSVASASSTSYSLRSLTNQRMLQLKKPKRSRIQIPLLPWPSAETSCQMAMGYSPSLRKLIFWEVCIFTTKTTSGQSKGTLTVCNTNAKMSLWWWSPRKKSWRQRSWSSLMKIISQGLCRLRKWWINLVWSSKLQKPFK